MEIGKKIKLMEQYLMLKVEERDWHGVADAAMDLREMEVEVKMKPIFLPGKTYLDEIKNS